MRRPAVSAICLAIAGGCAAWRIRGVHAFGPSDFDDAYMFVRYAQHILDGHGLRWNIGAASVYGVTSLLHLAVVVGLRAATSLSDGRLIQVTSCAAGLLAVLVMALGCARVGRSRQVTLWLAILAPLVLFTDPFVFHARTGMDTMLSLLANSVLALATVRLASRPTPRAALLASAAGYLTVLVRPDNVLVALLCPALSLLLARAWRPLAIFAGALVALLAADAAVKTAWLGTALPLAFYVKQRGVYGGFAGEYGWNPFLFLKVFLTAALPFVAVLLVMVRRDRWRLPFALLAPAALTIALLFGVTQIMGHLGRFYFPFLPFVVLSAAWTLDGARPPALRLAAAALIILAGGPALSAAGRRWERPSLTADLGGYSAAPLPELDSWQASVELGELARAAPAGTVLAMSEHGLVGARAPRATIVDVLGLHDPAFRRFSVAELWRRRPDVLWMPHPDHTQMLRDILDSDELWAEYDFYPDAFTYGVALRRQSPNFPGLFSLFEARWRSAYPGSRPAEHVARRAPRE